MLRAWRLAAAAALICLLVAPAAGAVGTETLGAPGIAIASGSDVLVAGAGNRDARPAFTVDVPGTVNQALLYWTGHYSELLGGSADGEVTLLKPSGGPVGVFGKTNPGTEFGFPGQDRKYGNKFTLAEPGFVTKITAHMKGADNGGGEQRFRAMIYAADGPGGVPGSLLATSAEVLLSDATPEGPVDFAITPRVGLNAGDYWLMQHSGPANKEAGLSQIASVGGTNQYNVDRYDDGPSNPAGSLTGEASEYTLSASYEPATAIPLAGTLIGGPTLFFTSEDDGAPLDARFATYRADITQHVQSGANEFAVADMDFHYKAPGGNDGAGVLVVYDDGSGTKQIDVRDGQDLAFHPDWCCLNPPSDLGQADRQTTAQTFTFLPSPNDRTATLVNLAGGVLGQGPPGPRPTQLVIGFDVGGTTVLESPFNSLQGFEFDALNTSVTVPASATQMTVQALSEGEGGKPASFTWVGVGLSLAPPPPPPPCSLGDFVWNDKDHDGKQDDGSYAGINGVLVELIELPGGTVVRTTTTGSHPATSKPGWYHFEVTCRTQYVVRVAKSNFDYHKPLSGMIGTAPNVGSDDSIDSDGDLLNHHSPPVTVTAGAHDGTIDFGFIKVCDPSKVSFLLKLACFKLDLFIKAVKASTHLSPEKRDALVAAALRLKQHIGCR